MNDCSWLKSKNCTHDINRGGRCIGSTCREYTINKAERVIMNDGGSADYYKLPEGVTDLQDLIEYKDLNFALGNIMKSVYRMNDNTHSDRARDLRKILWFAERELAREG